MNIKTAEHQNPEFHDFLYMHAVSLHFLMQIFFPLNDFLQKILECHADRLEIFCLLPVLP